MTVGASAGQRDRARGALVGLAVGDALGMPAQMLTRDRVAGLWGRIRGFETGPAESEIAPLMPAGRVTDDTDQAVILAELLLAGGGYVDPEAFAGRLLDWESRLVARGSLDLLGPSTKRAIDAFRAGTAVTATGRWGDTNGAAMRVAPVGVLMPAGPVAALAERVAHVNEVTHNTGVANAGASAVAAAVSAGVDGASVGQAVAAAVQGAHAGALHGHYVPGADVASRISWACALVGSAGSDDEALDLVVRLVGTGVATQEAVPAAVAIAARWGEDPWTACCQAASLGGDSDTIAAMTGAILGACHGASAFPAEAVRALGVANPGLRLGALADALLDLRGPS